MQKVLAYDVVVVGRGVAGLLAALKANDAGASVLVMGTGHGASAWLQGVNVAFGHADPRDSPRTHTADIIREGYGLGDPGIAKDTAIDAIAVLQELDALGVGFAKKNGHYLQRHPSGSSYPRCCFVPGMMWGPRTQTVLTDILQARPQVRFETARAVRVLRSDGRVCGLLAVRPRSGEPLVCACSSVVLASGGVGGVFAHSTYPADIVGSSYAMAFHAGAELIDMEFVQFEPLVAYHPKAIRGYVVPTTLFGDGATLRDRDEARFLLDIRPQGEAGIGKETLVLAMAETANRGQAGPDGEVWLDARNIPEATLEGYPWLYPYLRERGVDLRYDMLPVLPAAHTALGGIVVDRRRQTSIPGLFAAGEAAGGLHGAGRLAGGSGTDVLASGARAGTEAATVSEHTAIGAALDISQAEFRLEACLTKPTPEQSRVLADVRAMMSDHCGIWRNGSDLEYTFERVRAHFEVISLNQRPRPGDFAVRLADILLVAGMVLDTALRRTESRGAHQRTDYPRMDSNQARSTELGWSVPFARSAYPVDGFCSARTINK